MNTPPFIHTLLTPPTHRMDLSDIALLRRHRDGDGQRADVGHAPGLATPAQSGVGGPGTGGGITEPLKMWVWISIVMLRHVEESPYAHLLADHLGPVRRVRIEHMIKDLDGASSDSHLANGHSPG